MANVEEKVNCIPWLAELKSTSAVRRKFTSHYGKEAPHRNSVNNRMKKFKQTGSIYDKPRSRRCQTSEETVADVQRAFEQSPKKSVHHASAELNILKNSTQKTSIIKLSNFVYCKFIIFINLKLLKFKLYKGFWDILCMQDFWSSEVHLGK